MDIQKCEICEKTFIAGYGYSMIISWVVTGHAYLKAFVCPKHPSGQHWGCSPEHAYQAALDCLNSHMTVKELQNRHKATGIPRYAEEHKDFAETRGENFHIINIEGDII